jgi:hypothetical protein
MLRLRFSASTACARTFGDLGPCTNMTINGPITAMRPDRWANIAQVCSSCGVSGT